MLNGTSVRTYLLVFFFGCNTRMHVLLRTSYKLLYMTAPKHTLPLLNSNPSVESLTWFPGIWGTVVGAPIIRIVVFWGVYWDPPPDAPRLIS